MSGSGNTLRAILAYEILSKALDTTKLVRVQRPVSRNGKTFMQHKWVKPDKVRKGDVVIANREVLEEWRRQNAGKKTQEKSAENGGGAQRAGGQTREDKPASRKRGAHTGRKQKAAPPDADALDPAMAKGQSALNRLALINSISDKTVLATALDTGAIPADEGAYEFLRGPMQTAVHLNSPWKVNNEHANASNLEASLSNVPDSLPAGIVEQVLFREGMLSGDFSSHLLNPCVSFGFLSNVPIASTGSRHVTQVGSFMEALVPFPQHLGAIESAHPELKAECIVMEREFLELHRNRTLSKFEKLRTGTAHRKKQKGKDEYNKIVGDVLHFFGAALADEDGTEITNYADLSPADMQRMHYETKASPEREAIVMNLVLAAEADNLNRSMKDLCSWRDVDGYSYETQPPAMSPRKTRWRDEQIENTPVVGMDFYRNAKAFASQMPLSRLYSGASAGVQQGINAALRNAPVEPEGKFFSDHPTPVKEALYLLAQNMMRYAPGYEEPEGRPVFTEKDVVQSAHWYDKANLPLRELREKVFYGTTCVLRSGTPEEQKEWVDKLEADKYTGIDMDDEETKAVYDNRVLLTRGMYVTENSVMEDAFRAYVEEEGLETHLAYNGTSFESMCSMLREGQYYVPQHEDECSSGAMLGFGVYESYSPYKSMMYAASRPFWGNYEEYDGTDDMTSGFLADGVLSIIESTYGRTYREFTDIDEGAEANKAMGGDCDAIICRAKDTPGLRADEACLSASRMMFPKVIFDAGARVKNTRRTVL